VILRNCSIDHLGEIVKIEEESFPPSDRYSLWLLQALCSRCWETSFVLEYEGKVVGYVVACVEGDKGHVINIAVRPKYRGKGLGKLLMCKTLLALAMRGIKSVFLEVRVSNAPAIGLYERLNFRIKERLNSYYSDGEDAYLMELDELDVEKVLKMCPEQAVSS